MPSHDKGKEGEEEEDGNKYEDEDKGGRRRRRVSNLSRYDFRFNSSNPIPHNFPQMTGAQAPLAVLRRRQDQRSATVRREGE